MNASGMEETKAVETALAVAHDFNNVLTVIAGNLTLAERHAAGNPKLIRLLQNIRLAADRAAELTAQLSALAGAAAPPSPAPGDPPQPVPEHRTKVLVVEDDPDVAEIAAAVIESLGHEVEMCAEAGAALALVEQDGDFDLVFSDIVMPGAMNGIELAETLHAKFPRLPVLLATGYSNAALAPGALRFPVLAKPYSVQELSRRIAQLITRG